MKCEVDPSRIRKGIEEELVHLNDCCEWHGLIGHIKVDNGPHLATLVPTYCANSNMANTVKGCILRMG